MQRNYLQKVKEILRYKKELSCAEFSLEALPGDASLRRYFRLTDKKAGTYILMLSEAFRSETNNFLLVQKLFHSRNIPVPEVLDVEEKEGLVLLSDLGNKTMLHSLETSIEQQIEIDLFKNAIELMMDIHEIKAEPECKLPAFSMEFDEEMLMSEVNFTFRYFFTEYLERKIPKEELASMKDSFRHICHSIAKEDKVLSHRDFHTRNLMINDQNQLFCIDFQDARMGPLQYDLCSILCDSYYQLSEAKVEQLLTFYINNFERRYKKLLDREKFIQVFNLVSIQRNFKAIGSFASFCMQRKNPKYLRFIGNTFENIRRNLEKFPEYVELHKLLFKWYYF